VVTHLVGIGSTSRSFKDSSHPSFKVLFLHKAIDYVGILLSAIVRKIGCDSLVRWHYKTEQFSVQRQVKIQIHFTLIINALPFSRAQVAFHVPQVSTRDP